MKNVSVIGLGKLGLCSAACFASKGYKVIGVDIDAHRVDLINKGENPISETGLTKLLKQCKGNLGATTDYKEAISNSDVTFIFIKIPHYSAATRGHRNLVICHFHSSNAYLL